MSVKRIPMKWVWEFRRMRESGYTIKEIAEKYGVSETSVSKYTRGYKYKENIR